MADIMAAETQPILYERIGGEPALDAAVERLYDLILADSRVNFLFDGVDMARLRRMQKMFLNHVLGHKPYNGKTLREAHKHLPITDAHFDVIGELTVRALKDLNVQQDCIDELVGIIGSTRDDVLGRTPEA